MKANAVGIIGEVYETETGIEKYDPKKPPLTGTFGWEQITVNTRRLVVRRRSNSKKVIWDARKSKEYYLPFSHKTDGALF